VIVENGGYGADYAAPIANLMIERYLSKDRSVPSQKPDMLDRMLKANLTGKTTTVKDSIIIVKPK
jgi:hypothetical protein